MKDVGKTMHFVRAGAIARDVAESFVSERHTISSLIPHAVVEHIGSTAIHGAMTKGDLDILVSVDASSMAEADRVLSERYARNEASGRSETFSAFVNDSGRFAVGIQLVATGSEDDLDFRVVQAELSRPQILAKYNELKRRFEGRSAKAYRTAKDDFIRQILSSGKTARKKP